MILAKKLSIEFNFIRENIREAYIAVGMVTDNKYDFFTRNLPSGADAFLITGVQLPTSPSVLVKIKDSNVISGKVYTKKFFHPKLYLFKVLEYWVAYVGSGNFTDGGWHENEELFIKITDEHVCKSLKDRFDEWYNEAIEISDEFIEIYKAVFISNQRIEKEQRTNVNRMLDLLNKKFNIENVDFTDQFFQKSDHLAFQPGKTHLETPEILEERRAVRNKLYHLNSLLVDKIPKRWDIHPHYSSEHIVAHIENHFHHGDNVKALWLAYGRDKTSLKQYGDWATPLEFMRMQVIVRYDDVGIWLMPGKQGGGRIDREYFAQQMQDDSYKQAFFELLTNLGKYFWIEIAGERKDVMEFEHPESLYEFVKNDIWYNYYFTMGINFPLGRMELKSKNIVNTIVATFERLIPLYNLIKSDGLQ